MRHFQIGRAYRTQSLILGLAVVLALVLLGCSGEQAGDGQALPPPEVSIAQVLSRSVQQWDEYTGRVSAIDTIELRARVSGYVQRFAYQEGQEVKQGDLLFLIDQRPYRMALDNAQAQLDRAREAKRLASMRDKSARLLIEAEAISQEELDMRSTTLTQSAADIDAAKAVVANAKLQLEFTEVRAPIAGKTSRARITAGNLAVADQTILTTIVSQDPMYVYFDVDESSYLRYGEQERDSGGEPAGTSVRVGLANEEGYPHTGTINFFDNQVNADVGTIRVRAVLPNADRIFTPGLFVRVQFTSDRKENVLLIDDKAVMTDQDRKYVYVVGKDNKIQRKDIVPGRMAEGLRVIQSGLAPDDKVVVAGQQKIYPGVLVKPNETPMAKL
ncbi:efflux RND transporter periplasmic adaptor subunit [Nitrosomonas mobilis]|uniref:Multidrug efflux transporter, membrane fusion protein n=1 Tax=Nitrosomonas mobilis TaxID=51642 RepID=A0A1G5SG07_9PROT|nr:efflux RND transporter periplasmic adaptor subunit [Nitrosomonas mobilis]SCZ86135.1 Multidrug efflux transporter, membrane fusion protein [Nitrosomonas mobilis]